MWGKVAVRYLEVQAGCQLRFRRLIRALSTLLGGAQLRTLDKQTSYVMRNEVNQEIAVISPPSPLVTLRTVTSVTREPLLEKVFPKRMEIHFSLTQVSSFTRRTWLSRTRAHREVRSIDKSEPRKRSACRGRERWLSVARSRWILARAFMRRAD